LNLSAPLPQGAAGEYPPLAARLQKVREKDKDAWFDVAGTSGWDLPTLVALGLVDSIEVADGRFGRSAMARDEGGGKPRDRDYYGGPLGMARWAHDVYFRLLECGLRIPPSAGSGSGVAPNPVGYNRVYVHLSSAFRYEDWWKSFRAGQVIVTNGPLMRPTANGELPGHVFTAEEGDELELEIGLTLSTCDPISYLEVVQNGEIKQSIRFVDYAKNGRLPKVLFKQSGWFLLRAVCDVSSTYRFAMTGPYYVEFGNHRRISKAAAKFFLDWVYQRARQIKLDDPAQRREVLGYHRTARDFWQDLVSKANVP
jgi:hypothetical protein